VADCCGRPYSEVQPAAWVVLADADRDVAAAVAWGEPAALVAVSVFAFGADVVVVAVAVAIVVVVAVAVGVVVVAAGVVVVAAGVDVVEPVFAAAADDVAEVAVAAAARELAEEWAPAWACLSRLCHHMTYTDHPQQSCLMSSALELNQIVNFRTVGKIKQILTIANRFYFVDGELDSNRNIRVGDVSSSAFNSVQMAYNSPKNSLVH
jgi:hypothetical protein